MDAGVYIEVLQWNKKNKYLFTERSKIEANHRPIPANRYPASECFLVFVKALVQCVLGDF